MKEIERRIEAVEKRINETKDQPHIMSLADLYAKIAEHGPGFLDNPARNNERYQG